MLNKIVFIVYIFFAKTKRFDSIDLTAVALSLVLLPFQLIWVLVAIKYIEFSIIVYLIALILGYFIYKLSKILVFKALKNASLRLKYKDLLEKVQN